MRKDGNVADSCRQLAVPALRSAYDIQEADGIGVKTKKTSRPEGDPYSSTVILTALPGMILDLVPYKTGRNPFPPAALKCR